MMKDMKFLAISLAAIALLAACSDNNESAVSNTSETVYPGNAIIWPKDTTVILTDHFLVESDQTLIVQEGATIIASNAEVKPEIVVLGSLYCLGTEENPITFTVDASMQGDRFSRNWGGIICGYDAPELVLLHTNIEYGGALTTENSLSFQNKLFKTETGEGVPAVHFCNRSGKMLIEYCTFRNNAEDQIYITGGESIVAHNTFICNGEDGGDAINYKSDCLADIAYNVVYDANTNGLKLSNGGFTDIQSHLYCYNNTLVNCGWRRPKKKGGSIWLEAGILVELYNNLVYDCRWGLKHDVSDEEDPNCVITPNYYFASTATGVEQMQADESEGILNGADDIMSETAGDKDPLFVNFTRQSNMNINVGDNVEGAPQDWDETWDFHLAAASPALTGGNVTFSRHFANGLTFAGLEGIYSQTTFSSPAPSAYFGAFGNE
ncbi:MAG: right-handed parallel beta-helix repeat-containing protein [Porphyromonadaceae bacterium]|nr:right-handed parallel beta-helix repeat-containing protein [Porphyromonadaceae bacterium]